jgi:hypothetical protein
MNVIDITYVIKEKLVIEKKKVSESERAQCTLGSTVGKPVEPLG